MFEWTPLSAPPGDPLPSGDVSLSRRTVLIGIAVPPLLSAICILWAALLSYQKGKGVVGAPFVVWVVGMVGFGALVSVFSLSSLEGSLPARAGLAAGVWAYLLLVAGGALLAGFLVLFTVSGGC